MMKMGTLAVAPPQVNEPDTKHPVSQPASDCTTMELIGVQVQVLQYWTGLAYPGHSWAAGGEAVVSWRIGKSEVRIAHSSDSRNT